MLEEKLVKPLALARKANLPLYCGEWGALPSVPRADRLRWYRDFRSVLEKNGIGWAHWDYKGGFGVVDGERNVQVDLAQALLGDDVILAAIESGDLGVFQGESEVGAVERPGATVFDQGRAEYRVTGGGENIWGTADAFHYAWQQVTGDVALAADIRFVGPGCTSTARPASWCGPRSSPTLPTSTPPFTGTGWSPSSTERSPGARRRR